MGSGLDFEPPRATLPRMARPLRIEFAGAVYHVTSRGDRREAIFDDDADRMRFLRVLGLGLARFDAQVLTYCLMGNHYHLVVYTRQANLSLLMRHLNGVYTQGFNRRHGTVGHLFQGRFKAILVDREAYLLELCRYVELNPVRAGMVGDAASWRWSSYRAHVGETAAQEWLDTAGLHAYLLGRPAVTAADRQRAARRYAELVASAPQRSLWDDGLTQQIYLGDASFVDSMQALAGTQRTTNAEVPRQQRSAPRELHHWLASQPTREAALLHAHREGGLTMTAIARELGLSVARVSQLIARAERGSN